MPAMAAVDAQFFLLSAVVPNDQFLVYAFDGEPDIGPAVAQLRRNAEGCADLRLRVADDGRWRYPRWEAAPITPEQFVVHPAATWQGCLDAVAGLEPLQATRAAWRVHVFPPAAVVVQISHALGDGTRSAALAGALLGRGGRVRPVVTGGRGFLPWRAVLAARAHRRLVREVEAGLLPPAPEPRPPLSVNARPLATPVLRTLTVSRELLSRPTVTVGALAAIGEALGGYLADRGEDVTRLGAEVPMAVPMHSGGGSAGGGALNNFRNVGVGLYPELASAERAERIAAELRGRRRRVLHPAATASAAAFAAVPGPLLRWGMGKFDPEARLTTVAGHTVVSSVNRGPADLSFGGRPVLRTAGFPALSPMMSLTHGVHGIGGSVTLGVCADPVNVDVEDYLTRLADALGCIP